MEGISVSESGLLLLCKILDPKSVVLCSILSLEIIPEGLSWGMLLQIGLPTKPLDLPSSQQFTPTAGVE